jgi:hypothetical protein
MSYSGLSQAHCRQATNLALQAAVLGYHHAPSIHYTQDSRRWEGIARGLKAWKGEFPHYADCSSYLTWCLKCGLSHFDKPGHRFPDIVNGQHWLAGFTGTLLEHGRRVRNPFPGCAIIYGPGAGEHTALYTGGGLVVSHGSERGPLLVPWRYRSDVHSIRSYIY